MLQLTGCYYQYMQVMKMKHTYQFIELDYWTGHILFSVSHNAWSKNWSEVKEPPTMVGQGDSGPVWDWGFGLQRGCFHRCLSRSRLGSVAQGTSQFEGSPPSNKVSGTAFVFPLLVFCPIDTRYLQSSRAKTAAMTAQERWITIALVLCIMYRL